MGNLNSMKMSFVPKGVGSDRSGTLRSLSYSLVMSFIIVRHSAAFWVFYFFQRQTVVSDILEILICYI